MLAGGHWWVCFGASWNWLHPTWGSFSTLLTEATMQALSANTLLHKPNTTSASDILKTSSWYIPGDLSHHDTGFTLVPFLLKISVLSPPTLSFTCRAMLSVSPGVALPTLQASVFPHSSYHSPSGCLLQAQTQAQYSLVILHNLSSLSDTYSTVVSESHPPESPAALSACPPTDSPLFTPLFSRDLQHLWLESNPPLPILTVIPTDMDSATPYLCFTSWK